MNDAPFANGLAQLESSWNKPRSQWDADDLRRAVASLELMLSVGSPAKRGRPKKTPGLWMAQRPKQPLSKRHQNFGEKNIKWTKERRMFLVCMVDALKIKHGLKMDKDALIKIAERICSGKRQGIIQAKAKTLAPQLTNARKVFSSDEHKEINRIAGKWSAEDLI